jgi:hypothetical protein
MYLVGVHASDIRGNHFEDNDTQHLTLADDAAGGYYCTALVIEANKFGKSANGGINITGAARKMEFRHNFVNDCKITAANTQWVSFKNNYLSTAPVTDTGNELWQEYSDASRPKIVSYERNVAAGVDTVITKYYYVNAAQSVADTPITLATITASGTSTTYDIYTRCRGWETSGVTRASYILHGMGYTDGAATYFSGVTVPVSTIEDDATWEHFFELDGNTFLIRAQGGASDIATNWDLEVEYVERYP